MVRYLNLLALGAATLTAAAAIGTCPGPGAIHPRSENNPREPGIHHASAVPRVARNPRARPARRHLQRLAEPKRAGTAEAGPGRPRRPAGAGGGGDRATQRPRHPAAQRIRLRRGGQRGRAVQEELPVGFPARPGRHRLPLRLPGAVQHRDSQRRRPGRGRGRGRRGRRTGLRRLRGPVRHGALFEVPHRHGKRPDLPGVPLEGHAPLAIADQRTTTRSCRACCGCPASRCGTFP